LKTGTACEKLLEVDGRAVSTIIFHPFPPQFFKAAGDNNPSSQFTHSLMTPAEISETPQYDTSIRLLDHLPDDLVDDAAALYLSALADKLIPVYAGCYQLGANISK
jgi:hypothetical protein